jgi:hypothetical protein
MSGLAQEDRIEGDFDPHDPDYPLLISARAVKEVP